MFSDPGIILFGKKIGLPATLPPQDQEQQEEKPCSSSDPLENAQSAHDQGIDEADDNPKTPSIDEEATSENLQSTDGETMNLQTRSLKKPDKILPCPRCDSMNTKFCYFNNSNVNQPRHFCKSCQRYWTAGGTMRNMPVGAGRRKKKTPPSSHYRYVISQEALESESGVNQIEFAPDSNRIQPKVLSFGQNTTESKLSGKENREHCCSDSNGFQSQVHWFPGGSIGSIGSWPYNPMNPWNTPIPIPIPPYGSIPMYPSPYWTSVSWLPPPGPPAQPGQPGQPGSVLGKHMIDSEPVKPNGSNEESKKQRNTVLTPKTLRIDDPDEAAKSSIWATLGIKNENCGRGDLFKAFQSKGTEKKKAAVTEHELPEPCPVLQANPAAFSRSLCFQERA